MNGGFGEAIRDPTTLPDGLPAPVDDGAVDHLPGVHVPDVVLPSTVGEMSLAASRRSDSPCTSTRGPGDQTGPFPRAGTRFQEHAAALRSPVASVTMPRS